jgi:hypothetical protein
MSNIMIPFNHEPVDIHIASANADEYTVPAGKYVRATLFAMNGGSIQIRKTSSDSWQDLIVTLPFKDFSDSWSNTHLTGSPLTYTSDTQNGLATTSSSSTNSGAAFTFTTTTVPSRSNTGKDNASLSLWLPAGAMLKLNVVSSGDSPHAGVVANMVVEIYNSQS